MRPYLQLLTACLALGAASGPAAARPSDPEAKLARALAGREAGAPVHCVNLQNIRSTTIINGTAILYDAGGTIYLNRPVSGQESLDRSDVLVTNPTMNRLCNVDVVKLYDSGLEMQTGVVFLGDFVPYRKPRGSSGR